MARCANCGKANRDGALFCQDCGQPLEPKSPAVSDDAATPERPPVAVAAPSPVAPADSADSRGPARISCPRCSQATPAGFSFCQHCGARMQSSPEALPRQPLPPVAGGRSGRPEVAPPPVAASPSAVPEPRPQRGSGGVVSASSAESASSAPSDPSGHHQSASAPEPPRSARAAGPSSALRGRLILLRRDGSDGDVIQLGGETFDLGRSEGSRLFPDDLYMAARHARFVHLSGGIRVRALDQVNGVFIQIREPFDLQAGDVFYLGRELIRLEILPHEERDPAPISEHGVRLFGTTPRESWGRLRQLTPAGIGRDIWHLCRAEVRIGREEGDIVFPDDEFMSRRHAVLTRHGNRVRIEDQHSSNGTYVRLRGDRELQQGDVLRVGDQVLRFEP